MVHAIDLFGGPGGVDLAARALGFNPLGIEWDDAACDTRRAAGLATLQADVAALDPVKVARRIFSGGWGKLGRTIVLGSPPCPSSWSSRSGGRWR